MKKIIYMLMLPLLLISGLVFVNREIKNTTKKSNLKPFTDAERKAARNKWEASPDGILFKKWEASLAGKKVHASIAKIRKPTKDYTNMEGIITSLSLPPGSRLGFGMMVKINNDDYILSFGPLKSNEFQHLESLKANDKIIIKSHFISFAPKYAYPIIAGEYIEKESKVIYRRPPNKAGC